MKSESEFDIAAIRRLDGFESDGQSLAEALVQELRTGGRAELTKLAAAAVASQFDAVRFLAHSLKSSGRALGLVGFGHACERVEHADPGRSDLLSMITDLERRFDEGCRWLSEVLAAD